MRVVSFLAILLSVGLVMRVVSFVAILLSVGLVMVWQRWPDFRRRHTYTLDESIDPMIAGTGRADVLKVRVLRKSVAHGMVMRFQDYKTFDSYDGHLADERIVSLEGVDSPFDGKTPVKVKRGDTFDVPLRWSAMARWDGFLRIEISDGSSRPCCFHRLIKVSPS